MNNFILKCPFCGNSVEVSSEHLMKNEKLCCMNCNKAFKVEVSHQKKAEPEDDFGFYDNKIDEGYWD